MAGKKINDECINECIHVEHIDGEESVIVRKGRLKWWTLSVAEGLQGAMWIKKRAWMRKKSLGDIYRYAGSHLLICCFTLGYFLPLWRCIGITTTLFVPSLFLHLSMCFSTPPFSTLLLFLTHTLPHWGCLNRWKSWSEVSESLVCWERSLNRSVCSWTQISSWKRVAFLKACWKRISYSSWTFASGAEDKDAPTFWRQGYDGIESYLVMHLRNVKLQSQILCVQVFDKKKVGESLVIFLPYSQDHSYMNVFIFSPCTKGL